MIALFAVVLFAVAAGAGKPFEGVDPNSLSCDPTGQEFLLLPHTEDCNKFFQCANGKEVLFVCPESLVFDFALQVCNWPWDTECVLRKPDDAVEGSGDYDEGTDEWASDAVATGQRPASHDASQKVETDFGSPTKPKAVDDSVHFKIPLDCRNPASAMQRIAYKDDCQRYWRCVDGAINSFFCTDGLFFNEKTQQCDFEANVICNVNHEHELQGEFMVYNS